jgi:hypothetical protein
VGVCEVLGLEGDVECAGCGRRGGGDSGGREDWGCDVGEGGLGSGERGEGAG